jgi:hypothetical protein
MGATTIPGLGGKSADRCLRNRSCKETHSRDHIPDIPPNSLSAEQFQKTKWYGPDAISWGWRRAWIESPDLQVTGAPPIPRSICERDEIDQSRFGALVSKPSRKIGAYGQSQGSPTPTFLCHNSHMRSSPTFHSPER